MSSAAGWRCHRHRNWNIDTAGNSLQLTAYHPLPSAPSFHAALAAGAPYRSDGMAAVAIISWTLVLDYYSGRRSIVLKKTSRVGLRTRAARTDPTFYFIARVGKWLIVVKVQFGNIHASSL